LTWKRLKDPDQLENKASQLLDNPIWHALTSAQADLSLGDDRARRYPSIITTLAGMRDESLESFSSLSRIVTRSERVGLCAKHELRAPEYWELALSFAVAQMVCTRPRDCKKQEMVVLTVDDVVEMKELARLTQPGPFADRTIELGTFYGIKDKGKLVAMAGERMKLDGFEEVSAVCTHPDFQGRGYARSLVSAVCQNITERGNTPFLHVKEDNTAGLASYASLGFEKRQTMVFSVYRREATLPPASEDIRFPGV